MPDRKIKRQRHPAKSFSKSPLSLCFLVPSCLSGYKLIVQNKPNSENPRITATPATAKNCKQKPPLPSRKKQTQPVAAEPMAKPDQTQFIAAKPLAKPDPPAPEHNTTNVASSGYLIYNDV